MLMLDIVRTKSVIGHAGVVRQTCRRLKLSKVHTRRVLPLTQSLRGMLPHLSQVALWTVWQTSDAPEPRTQHLHPPTKGYPRRVARTGAVSESQYVSVVSRMTKTL